MPNEPTENGTAQITPDAAAENTGAISETGAVTDPANNQAQPTEKTFTQADVDRIVQNRLKSAVKAELKKLTGETPETPTVQELQQQLKDATTKAQTFERKEAVQSYLTDPKNKISVKAQDLTGVVELAAGFIQYDEAGAITNLKEAVEKVKSLAPSLFAGNPAPNINQGRTDSELPNDMNAFIRQQHAERN